jgi:hypothetical protein
LAASRRPGPRRRGRRPRGSHRFGLRLAPSPTRAAQAFSLSPPPPTASGPGCSHHHDDAAQPACTASGKLGLGTQPEAGRLRPSRKWALSKSIMMVLPLAVTVSWHPRWITSDDQHFSTTLGAGRAECCRAQRGETMHANAPPRHWLEVAAWLPPLQRKRSYSSGKLGFS